MKATYNVNDKFLGQLRAAISSLNNAQQHQQISASSAVSPALYVSNSKLYFTNSDVRTYLFVAAGIGSGALGVALAGVGTLIGGPVGLFISAVLVVIGLGTLTNLCYLVIQAVTLNQGVYIGLNWNGPFPNYSQGTW